jgi:hypothetical protein
MSDVQSQPQQPGLQQTALQVDKMKESPHVWGDSDFSEIEESDIDESKIFWMGTNANLEDTPQEQLESKMAIREQVQKGILDEMGIPTGFTYDELGIPKEVQDQLRANKAQRAAGAAAQQPQPQSIPQYQNAPPPRKFANKWEKKAVREREKMEKLFRANKAIADHQTMGKLPPKTIGLHG